MEGDVFVVFASVDEGQAGVLGVFGGGVVEAVEGVGAIVGYVVVVGGDGAEDLADEGFGDLGD